MTDDLVGEFASRLNYNLVVLSQFPADHTLAVPTLKWVIRRGNAFGQSFAGYKRDAVFFINKTCPNDIISCFSFNSIYASSNQSHRANFSLVKSDAHAACRGQQYILLAVGQKHLEKLILVVNSRQHKTIR